MAGRVAGAHDPHRCGGGVVDAHGWNISKRTRCSLTREHDRTRVLVVVLGWWCGGTLLGCRSTSYVGWFPGALSHPLWWVCGVGGLLFVNYIVDASIFDAACIWSHVDHGRGVFWIPGCGGVVGVCGVFFDDCFVLCGV